MPDREKVIKGLECCILRDPDDHARCSQCSYGGNCVNRLKMDALELLKAQEPVEPEKRELPFGMYDAVKYEYKCGMCGCGLMRNEKWRANYCPECGHAVKWPEPPKEVKQNE